MMQHYAEIMPLFQAASQTDHVELCHYQIAKFKSIIILSFISCASESIFHSLYKRNIKANKQEKECGKEPAQQPNMRFTCTEVQHIITMYLQFIWPKEQNASQTFTHTLWSHRSTLTLLWHNRKFTVLCNYSPITVVFLQPLLLTVKW